MATRSARIAASQGRAPYLGASPSKKSVQRLKTTVGAILVPRNKGSWPNVCERLNSLLFGWSRYFGYGSLAKAYRAADGHVVDRVRHFLVKRHKVKARGTRRFSWATIHGELRVLALWRHQGVPAPTAVQ